MRKSERRARGNALRLVIGRAAAAGLRKNELAAPRFCPRSLLVIFLARAPLFLFARFVAAHSRFARAFFKNTYPLGRFARLKKARAAIINHEVSIETERDFGGCGVMSL